MAFFFVLIAFTGIATAFAYLGGWGLADVNVRMRLALSGALILFGMDHLITPERYLPMIEGFVPFPEIAVALTGVCEIAGALGLLVQKTRWLAGLFLALYFVCVFPANIANALNGLTVEGLPGGHAYYWVRLVFQPVAIWWSLVAGGVLPLRQRGARIITNF